MADPTGTLSDGIVFGAQYVTIASVEWVADDISYTGETKTVNSSDPFGVHRGAAFMNGPTTGSMTLRFPLIEGVTADGGTTGVSLPARQSTFTLKSKGGTEHSFCLLNVGENQGSEKEPTINCTFQKLENAA